MSKIKCLEELEKTSLEWTAVCNGIFLDYWGMPKVKSYMTAFTLILDIANCSAAIPGSGDVPVVFTHTSDVAKYVALCLSLPTWERESYIIGDRLTWNEFAQLAEQVRGKLHCARAYCGRRTSMRMLIIMPGCRDEIHRYP